MSVLDSMHPSNFVLEVISTGRADFGRAMQIAFEKDRLAVAWRTFEEKGDLWFAFGWYEGITGYDLLPYGMDVEEATNFAWGWLMKNRRPKSKCPDIDGSVDEGAFCVRSRECASYDIVQIRAEWALYHK